MGLTISHELTRVMGGVITAESEIGKGSVFSFTIPFERAHDQPATPVPAAGLRGLHVLVVADNATTGAYSKLVSRPGRCARTSPATRRSNGMAPHGGAERDPFDLALPDLTMPGESGVRLARRIAASASLRPTRAHAEVDAAKAGIRYHLTKPVRQSRLLEAISLAMAPVARDHDESEHERQAGSTPSTRAPSLILVPRTKTSTGC